MKVLVVFIPALEVHDANVQWKVAGKVVQNVQVINEPRTDATSSNVFGFIADLPKNDNKTLLEKGMTLFFGERVESEVVNGEESLAKITFRVAKQEKSIVVHSLEDYHDELVNVVVRDLLASLNRFPGCGCSDAGCFLWLLDKQWMITWDGGSTSWNLFHEQLTLPICRGLDTVTMVSSCSSFEDLAELISKAADNPSWGRPILQAGCSKVTTFLLEKDVKSLEPLAKVVPKLENPVDQLILGSLYGIVTRMGGFDTRKISLDCLREANFDLQSLETTVRLYRKYINTNRDSAKLGQVRERWNEKRFSSTSPMICALGCILRVVDNGDNFTSWKVRPGLIKEIRQVLQPNVLPGKTKDRFLAFCRKFVLEQCCWKPAEWSLSKIIQTFPGAFSDTGNLVQQMVTCAKLNHKSFKDVVLRLENEELPNGLNPRKLGEWILEEYNDLNVILEHAILHDQEASAKIFKAMQIPILKRFSDEPKVLKETSTYICGKYKIKPITVEIDDCDLKAFASFMWHESLIRGLIPSEDDTMMLLFRAAGNHTVLEFLPVLEGMKSERLDKLLKFFPSIERLQREISDLRLMFDAFSVSDGRDSGAVMKEMIGNFDKRKIALRSLFAIRDALFRPDGGPVLMDSLALVSMLRKCQESINLFLDKLSDANEHLKLGQDMVKWMKGRQVFPRNYQTSARLTLEEMLKYFPTCVKLNLGSGNSFSTLRIFKMDTTTSLRGVDSSWFLQALWESRPPQSDQQQQPGHDVNLTMEMLRFVEETKEKAVKDILEALGGGEGRVRTFGSDWALFQDPRKERMAMKALLGASNVELDPLKEERLDSLAELSCISSIEKLFQVPKLIVTVLTKLFRDPLSHEGDDGDIDDETRCWLQVGKFEFAHQEEHMRLVRWFPEEKSDDDGMFRDVYTFVQFGKAVLGNDQINRWYGFVIELEKEVDSIKTLIGKHREMGRSKMLKLLEQARSSSWFTNDHVLTQSISFLADIYEHIPGIVDTITRDGPRAQLPKLIELGGKLGRIRKRGYPLNSLIPLLIRSYSTIDQLRANFQALYEAKLGIVVDSAKSVRFLETSKNNSFTLHGHPPKSILRGGELDVLLNDLENQLSMHNAAEQEGNVPRHRRELALLKKQVARIDKVGQRLGRVIELGMADLIEMNTQDILGMEKSSAYKVTLPKPLLEEGNETDLINRFKLDQLIARGGEEWKKVEKWFPWALEAATFLESRWFDQICVGAFLASPTIARKNLEDAKQFLQETNHDFTIIGRIAERLEKTVQSNQWSTVNGATTLKLEDNTPAVIVIDTARPSNNRSVTSWTTYALSLLHGGLYSSSRISAVSLFPIDGDFSEHAVLNLCKRIEMAAVALKENIDQVSYRLGSFVGMVVTGIDLLPPMLFTLLVNACQLYFEGSDGKLEIPKLILITVEKRLVALEDLFPHLTCLESDPLAQRLMSQSIELPNGIAFVNPIISPKNRACGNFVHQHGAPNSSSSQPQLKLRVLVRKDSTIEEFVRDLKDSFDAAANVTRKGVSIVLDCYEDGKKIFDGALGPVILSFLLINGVGQAHQRYTSFKQPPCQLLVDVAEEDTHIPFVSSNKTDLSDHQFSTTTVRRENQQWIQVALDGIDRLIESVGNGAEHEEAIDDSRVDEALLGHTLSSKSSLRDRRPFIHSVPSLTLMAGILRSIQERKPVIVSGSTGTGKTYTCIKLVEHLIAIGIPDIASKFLTVISFSAAFDARIVFDATRRVQCDDATTTFAILDEITATEAQSSIEWVTCVMPALERSDKKVIYLSTCNPDEVRDDVFPLAKSLRSVTLRMEPPGEGSMKEMILKTFFGAIGKDDNLARKGLDIYLRAKQSFDGQSKRYGVLSVRDVAKCGVIVRNLFSRNEALKQVLELNEEDILLLATYMVIGMRVVPRSKFHEAVGLNSKERLNKIRDKIVQSFMFGDEIVKTIALKENLLALTVASVTYQPLLLFGGDGMSKSLSIRLAVEQMRGVFSATELLRKAVPRVQSYSIQFSPRTTATTIRNLAEALSNVASSSSTMEKGDRSVPCAVMEELSMASMGREGPLRALHGLLDDYQLKGGREYNPFVFFSTSNPVSGRANIPIGEALANRMIVLVHEEPTKENLISLALGGEGVSDAVVPMDDDSAPTDRSGGIQFCKEILRQVVRFVPHDVSVRSLIYFAQTMIRATVDIPSDDERVALAAAIHLQKRCEEESKALFDKVLPQQPSCELMTVLPLLFREGLPPRPVMVLYDSVGDMGSWMRHIFDAEPMLFPDDWNLRNAWTTDLLATEVDLQLLRRLGCVRLGLIKCSDVTETDRKVLLAAVQELVNSTESLFVGTPNRREEPLLNLRVANLRSKKMERVCEDILERFAKEHHKETVSDVTKTTVGEFLQHWKRASPYFSLAVIRAIFAYALEPSIDSNKKALEHTLNCAHEIRQGTKKPIMQVICPAEDGDSATDSLSNIHTLLHLGKPAYLVNPMPIMDSIHGLLNDIGHSLYSTIQIGDSFENVRLREGARVFLFLHRQDANQLHRAVLSRVSVLNSGFPIPKSADGRASTFQSINEQLLVHFRNLDPKDGDNWIPEAILDKVDNTVTKTLHDIETNPTYKPIVVLVTTLKHKIADDDATKDLRLIQMNPGDGLPHFLAKVQSALSREPPTIVVLDLTQCDNQALVHVLINLGFAGSVSCGGVTQNGPEQWHPVESVSKFLLSYPKARLMLLVHPKMAPLCTPGTHKVKDANGNRKEFQELVEMIELVDTTAQFKDWPTLREMATDRCKLQDRCMSVIEMYLRQTNDIPEELGHCFAQLTCEFILSRRCRFLGENPVQAWREASEFAMDQSLSIRVVVIESIRSSIFQSVDDLIRAIGGKRSLRVASTNGRNHQPCGDRSLDLYWESDLEVAKAVLGSYSYPFQKEDDISLNRLIMTPSASVARSLQQGSTNSTFPFAEAILETVTGVDREEEVQQNLSARFPGIVCDKQLREDLVERLVESLDGGLVGGSMVLKTFVRYLKFHQHLTITKVLKQFIHMKDWLTPLIHVSQEVHQDEFDKRKGNIECLPCFVVDTIFRDLEGTGDDCQKQKRHRVVEVYKSLRIVLQRKCPNCDNPERYCRFESMMKYWNAVYRAGDVDSCEAFRITSFVFREQGGDIGKQFQQQFSNDRVASLIVAVPHLPKDAGVMRSAIEFLFQIMQKDGVDVKWAIENSIYEVALGILHDREGMDLFLELLTSEMSIHPGVMRAVSGAIQQTYRNKDWHEIVRILEKPRFKKRKQNNPAWCLIRACLGTCLILKLFVDDAPKDDWPCDLLFSNEYAEAKALRNMFLRASVRFLGEQNLIRSPLVKGIVYSEGGHFDEDNVSLVPPPEGNERFLSYIDDFKQPLNHEQTDIIDSMFLALGITRRSDVAIDLSNLSFCMSVALFWTALVMEGGPFRQYGTAGFSCPSYVRKLDQSIVPCVPFSSVELVRYTVGGITTVNRCRCGLAYGIGNCGLPMVQASCPNCGGRIGGNNHQFVDGNEGVQDDGTIFGVPLDWFEEASGHTERDLDPLSYRLLSILLLIPLVVFETESQIRVQRKAQLERHWKAFRNVAGFSSDDEAQAGLIGFLEECRQKPELGKSIALVECNFLGDDGRLRWVMEKKFMDGVRELCIKGSNLKASLSFWASKVWNSVISDELSNTAAKYRESTVQSLCTDNPEQHRTEYFPEACRFDTVHEGNTGDTLDVVKEQIWRQFQTNNEQFDFPFLLMSAFSQDLQHSWFQEIALAKSTPEWIRDTERMIHHFGVLIKGFSRIHLQVKEMTPKERRDELGSALDVVRKVLKGADVQKFKEAWDVCRYGHRFECQDVSDLGALEALTWEDVLIFDRFTQTPGKTILENLINAHNGQIEHILSSFKGKSTHKKRTLFLRPGGVDHVEKHMIPWEDLGKLLKCGWHGKKIHLLEKELMFQANGILGQSLKVFCLSRWNFPKIPAPQALVEISGIKSKESISRDLRELLENLDDREELLAILEWAQLVSAEQATIVSKVSESKVSESGLPLKKPPRSIHQKVKVEFQDLLPLQRFILETLYPEPHTTLAVQYRAKLDNVMYAKTIPFETSRLVLQILKACVRHVADLSPELPLKDIIPSVMEYESIDDSTCEAVEALFEEEEEGDQRGMFSKLQLKHLFEFTCFIDSIVRNSKK